MKIYPRLRSLLLKDYFRFYKVNLNKECPFWSDDSRCAIRYCHVEACLEEDIPVGLKGHHLRQPSFEDDALLKYSREAQNHDCEPDHDKELGYLNTTISAAAYEEFARWKVHDDATDNFCVINGEDEEAQYVDLLLNPERYTGYKGKSAHRIWNSIYRENCFRPKNSYRSYIETSNLNGMCLEKRVFYRVISGLHTSINIHLCSKFLLSDKSSLGLDAPGGRWGPNIEEFHRRFDPNTTNGEGPHWLRNLYFLYLLELRALAKAAPYLIREEYYTGNEQEDEEVRKAMRDLLQIVKSFPDHFNESVMFNGGKQARKLKDEFRQHFRNISRIMDCVGCEKCKLWGKLQIHGLGTALKILFSGKFDGLNPSGTDLRHLAKSQFQLDRNEIVAFINAFGRLSTSIFELEMFREMMR
ncbi:ero1-like protein isoform X2 [Anabrus simplex]